MSNMTLSCRDLTPAHEAALTVLLGAERVAQLRAAGQKVVVTTCASSETAAAFVNKYLLSDPPAVHSVEELVPWLKLHYSLSPESLFAAVRCLLKSEIVAVARHLGWRGPNPLSTREAVLRLCSVLEKASH